MTSETPDQPKTLAVLTWGQFLAALGAVGLGVYYDGIEKTPGFLVLAGLGILGGPAFWWAFKLAHGGGSK